MARPLPAASTIAHAEPSDAMPARWHVVLYRPDGDRIVVRDGLRSDVAQALASAIGRSVREWMEVAQ